MNKPLDWILNFQKHLKKISEQQAKEDYFLSKEGMLNSSSSCKHLNKSNCSGGTLFCTTCGEDFGQIITVHEFVGKKGGTAKETLRIKNYNKTMDKKFPNLFLPDGLVMMRDIERRFSQLEEDVGSFPNIKDVLYFILKRIGRQDLADTISITKSRRSHDILEKLFENNEDTGE